MDKPARKFTKLPLTTKATVILGIFFIVFGFLLSRITRFVIQDTFRVQLEKLTSEFVEVQVRDHLSAENFKHRERSREEIQKEHHSFNSFFKSIETEDIVKVKMWDDQATVIHVHDNFSERIDFEIINQSFPENQRYQRAINGEVNTEIKPPSDPENVEEQGFDKLMEVYIPVYLEGQSDPVGVAEVYYRVDRLNKQIAYIDKVVIVSITTTFALLYVTLLMVVSNASRKLEKQNEELEKSRAKLSQQAQNLEKAVEQRTSELSARTKELENKTKELEELNKVMVGRELRMAEMKKEIKKMKEDS